jgi:hypothetical protein
LGFLRVANVTATSEYQRLFKLTDNGAQTKTLCATPLEMLAVGPFAVEAYWTPTDMNAVALE